MVSPDAPSPRQMSHGMRKVYNGWLTLLAWGLYISAFSFTLRLGYLLFCLFDGEGAIHPGSTTFRKQPEGLSIPGMRETSLALSVGHMASLKLDLFMYMDPPSLVAQKVKNLPAMQETQGRRVQSLSQEDPLEKEMATHSSILAWKGPWAEESGELHSPWGCEELDMTEWLTLPFHVCGPLKHQANLGSVRYSQGRGVVAWPRVLEWVSGESVSCSHTAEDLRRCTRYEQDPWAVGPLGNFRWSRFLLPGPGWDWRSIDACRPTAA